MEEGGVEMDGGRGVGRGKGMKELREAKYRYRPLRWM